jgi:hypothetical protein
MITLFSVLSIFASSAACPDGEIPSRKMVSDIFNGDQGKPSSEFEADRARKEP